MVNYVCIGKGTTDENGIAHITHDCNGNPLSEPGYKGSGAGETLIVASLDKPVASDSILSNVLTITDIDNYSLVLSADKSIIQSTEVSVLSATLKNNNIPLSGKTIDFYNYHSCVLVANTATTVSDKYSIELPSTVTGYVYLEASKSNLVLYVSSSGNDLTVYPSGGSPSIIYDVVSVEYANDVLTVTQDDDTVTEVDCSSYDMSSVTSTVTGVVINNYGVLSEITNSSGVASVNYTGTGSGLREVIARYGTLQSEIYELIDSIYYVPILSNSLENGFSIVNTSGLSPSYSSDWKSVGDYSLKCELTQFQYFGITKWGSDSSDLIDDIKNVRVTVNISSPVRLMAVSRKTSDNAEYNDYIDITSSGTYTIPITIDEDIKKIDLRVANRQNNTVTAYFDNVVFY